MSNNLWLICWTTICFFALIVFVVVYNVEQIPDTVPLRIVQTFGYGMSSSDLSTVDGIPWIRGRVLLIHHPDYRDGFYVKVHGTVQLEEPILDTSFFEVGVLYGDTFANQQLFLIGPTMMFTAFNRVSSPVDDNVTNLRVAGNSTVGGDVVMGDTATVNGQNLSQVNAQVQTWPPSLYTLSDFQITQLTNMGSNTIDSAAWTALGVLNQNVATTSAVTFAGLTVGLTVNPLPLEIVFDNTPGTDKVQPFPVGANGLIVEVQSAGGGGGSQGSTNDCGGGGGSGSLAIVLLNSSQMVSHSGLKYTIGAGGGQGSSGAASTLSWSGGSEDLIVTTFPGSGGGSGNSYGLGGAGGALPTFESGYFGWSKYGEYGTNGYDRGSDSFRLQAGQGGNTLRGAGARGSKNGVGGGAVPGTLGGGGGGGINQVDSYGGSAGGDGYVRILAF